MQSSSPIRLLRPHPHPQGVQAPSGPHGHILIQVIVEDRPQLQLLKAADRDRQTKVQMEFTEYSDPGRGGDTEA